MTCARCEQLEERVAWLESELGLSNRVELIGRLQAALRTGAADTNRVGRPQTASVVAALYAAHGRTLSRWHIMEAVPPITGRRFDDDRDPKIVDVWVCFARKWLGKDGIENVWGQGYRLSPIGLDRVRVMIDAEVRAA